MSALAKDNPNLDAPEIGDGNAQLELVAAALSQEYRNAWVMKKEIVALDDHLVDVLGNEMFSEGELMRICRLALNDSTDAGYQLSEMINEKIKGYAGLHMDRLAEKYEVA